MSQEELNQFLNNIVSSALETNMSSFLELALKGIDFNAPPHEIALQASLASATFSMRITSEIILKLLNQLDVISLDEIKYQNVPPDFKVIVGGLSIKEPEK